MQGAIKIFVQEHLPEIQLDLTNVDVQSWSVQIDHIHLVMGMPPKYGVSNIVGQMKPNFSWQLRFLISRAAAGISLIDLSKIRGPLLTCLGVVLWSTGLFSSTVGLNEVVM